MINKFESDFQLTTIMFRTTDFAIELEKMRKESFALKQKEFEALIYEQIVASLAAIPEIENELRHAAIYNCKRIEIKFPEPAKVTKELDDFVKISRSYSKDDDDSLQLVYKKISKQLTTFAQSIYGVSFSVDYEYSTEQLPYCLPKIFIPRVYLQWNLK
jgi:hypothetical protein